MDKSHGELMSLPLSAVEAVLSSDGLQVKSEDKVVNFILKWAPILYPEPEERRAILIKCLLQFIHFPYLSCQKLKEVLDCPDIDHEHELCKLVLDALFLKAEGRSAKCGLVERAYDIQPVKRVSFELSRPHCVVYFELKKQVCADHYQTQSRLFGSETFPIGGCQGFIKPQWHQHVFTQLDHFGLHVYVLKGSATHALDCEISVMKKPFEKFQRIYNVENSTEMAFDNTVLKAGRKNLFGVSWTDFMSDTSIYFIDGILHLRVELTLRD